MLIFITMCYNKFFCHVKSDPVVNPTPEFNLENHVEDMVFMPNATHELKLDLATEKVANSILKKELDSKVQELFESQARAN